MIGTKTLVCMVSLLAVLFSGALALADESTRKKDPLRDQVFERLLQHLETWPKRWNKLPAPVLKPSGMRSRVPR